MTRNRHRRHSSKGFTLIEIFIVMGLISLMVSAAIIGFGAGRSAEVARAANQLANALRYAYDKSRVTGEHYRVLVNLDKGTFNLQAADERMYLPATDREGRIAKIDPDKVRERDERDKRAEELYNRSIASRIFESASSRSESSDAKDDLAHALDPFAPTARKVPRRKPPLFSAFEEENAISGLSKPFSLPSGAKVVSVRTADDLEAITKGEAGIYFFPRGQTQLAHIQLQDEEGETRYTIKLEPLTGRVTIEDGLVDLVLPKEARQQEDDLGKRQTRRSF